MKHKKLAVFLSLMITASCINSFIIQAEDFVEPEMGGEIEALMNSDEDQNIINEGSSVITDTMNEAGIDFTDEPGVEFDSEPEDKMEDTDSEPEFDSMPPVDNAYNMKSFAGSLDCSDILLGEKPESTLKVFSYENGIEEYLDERSYTVAGYITEEEFLAEDRCLDNLRSFKPEPDTVGKWLLVFEGVTPYYGRQAVYITVHDVYDLSIYKWFFDGDVMAGENPGNALQVYLETSGERTVLDKEHYTILGYIPENVFQREDFRLENAAEFYAVPETEGNWLAVLEGAGDYYGRQAVLFYVKDKYDFSMYQCNFTKEKVMPGENVEEYIEVFRSNYDNSNILAPENYRVSGYVTEQEFAMSGYDLNNISNMQTAISEAGGWYLVLEGAEPYYGKQILWLEVSEPETSEVPETEETADSRENGDNEGTEEMAD